MKIIINNDEAPITKEDAEQMAESIEAFEEGKKQPKGRFEIIERLK